MKTVVIEGENGDFTMMRHGKNIKDMDRSSTSSSGSGRVLLRSSMPHLN